MKKTTKTVLIAAALTAAAAGAVAGALAVDQYIEKCKEAPSRIQTHYGVPVESVVSVIEKTK